MIRFLVALFSLVAYALPANAEVVKRCFPIFEQVDLNATMTGSIVTLPPEALDQKSFTFVAEADNDSGTTPTLDLQLDSCRSPSTSTCIARTTWDQCTTGTCFSTSGRNKDISSSDANIFPYLRVKATLAGTSPVYDVTIYACYK